MLSTFIYDTDAKELKVLNYLCKDVLAILTDEMCNMNICSNKQELFTILKNIELLDLICMDITQDGAIQQAERVREQYSATEMLLIANAQISPIQYMKPSIKASSLLIKPFSSDDAKSILKDFVGSFLEKRIERDEEQCFILESQDGIMQIPYEKIYYFEAKSKKVFVRLGNEEYGYYATLESLEKQLPEYYIRCHRGFIVNSKKIEKLYLSDNQIRLRNDMIVPVSRSYKGIIKERLRT